MEEKFCWTFWKETHIFLLDFMHEKIQGPGLVQPYYKGDWNHCGGGKYWERWKGYPGDTTLAPDQDMPEARTILGLFYCMSKWSLFLLTPVWVASYVFIYMWLKDLDMLILKRKRPKKNTNGFQIFEGCWVEELLEYSVCLQGVKLGSVGRCFRWSDFRAI